MVVRLAAKGMPLPFRIFRQITKTGRIVSQIIATEYAILLKKDMGLGLHNTGVPEEAAA